MSDRQRSDGRLLKAAVFFAVSVSLALAQTRITPPNNKYTPAQDVELGQQVGVTRNEIHSLQEATREFIDGLAQSNRSLRATGGLQNTNLSGRKGLVAILNNVSDVTGRGETVTVFTTLLRDGTSFIASPSRRRTSIKHTSDRSSAWPNRSASATEWS
jgi:hypothetical protein